MRSNYQHQIVTSQAIKEEGSRHGFCPYYYGAHTKNKADLIFMPYNYLLNEDLVSLYSETIKGSILIFDEAHNVPDSACDGRSTLYDSERFILLKK